MITKMQRDLYSKKPNEIKDSGDKKIVREEGRKSTLKTDKSPLLCKKRIF